MYCSKCGRELVDDWKVCPNCGNPVNKKSADIPKSVYIQPNLKSKVIKKRKLWLIIIVILISIMAVYIMVKNEKNQKENAKEISSKLNLNTDKNASSDQDLETIIGKSESDFEKAEQTKKGRNHCHTRTNF